MKERFEQTIGDYKYVFKLYNSENDPYYLQMVTLYYQDMNNDIGHFKVEGFSDGNGNRTPYNSGRTMDMTIFLEPEHTGRGLSRGMIKYLFTCSEEIFKGIPNDHNIYIDADGSNGFWYAIGMRTNKYYTTERNQLEGAGFEKVITYGELKKWINNNNEGGIKNKSRERKSITRKSTKRKSITRKSIKRRR
jgi:hypothetical protein